MVIYNHVLRFRFRCHYEFMCAKFYLDFLFRGLVLKSFTVGSVVKSSVHDDLMF